MDEGMRMDEALAQALEDMPPVQRARCSVLTASATDILWSDDADEHEVHREATRRHVAPKEPGRAGADGRMGRRARDWAALQPFSAVGLGMNGLRASSSRLRACPQPSRQRACVRALDSCHAQPCPRRRPTSGARRHQACCPSPVPLARRA